MSVASASTRAHVAGETQGVPSQPPPAVPLVQQTRLKRLWHRICSFSETAKRWLSTIGTIMMLLYQGIYAWQLFIPSSYLPAPGAQAWLVGLIALVAYVGLKAPHLFGQEPGDAKGLVREWLLNELNVLLAAVFLTAAYFGVSHAPNAVGITVMLFVMFISMAIAQAVQAIVLSRRTWTDSTGGGADA